jgi:hypothetical protein
MDNITKRGRPPKVRMASRVVMLVTDAEVQWVRQQYEVEVKLTFDARAREGWREHVRQSHSNAGGTPTAQGRELISHGGIALVLALADIWYSKTQLLPASSRNAKTDFQTFVELAIGRFEFEPLATEHAARVAVRRWKAQHSKATPYWRLFA